MCLLVASEIAWCAEGLEAVVAGVRFVLDVGHPVVVEVRAGGEALSTRLALVRSFPRVDPSVCVQGGQMAITRLPHLLARRVCTVCTTNT